MTNLPASYSSVEYGLLAKVVAELYRRSADFAKRRVAELSQIEGLCLLPIARGPVPQRLAVLGVDDARGVDGGVGGEVGGMGEPRRLAGVVGVAGGGEVAAGVAAWAGKGGEARVAEEVKLSFDKLPL